MNVYPVIMAGGSGTRFWPASRREHPKQLLPLVNGSSMFRLTVDRMRKQFSTEHIRVVTPPDLRKKLHEEAPELNDDAFIEEPVPRDTAACIGLTAMHLKNEDPDGAMFVLPSDHYIPDESHFLNTVSTAVQTLENHPRQLITFGITPDRPATGYGYIEMDEQIEKRNDIPVHNVRQFTEKPEREQAVEYLSSDQHLWNSGMFLWKMDQILNRLEEHAPDIQTHLRDFMKICSETDDPVERRSHFETVPENSIDYAVMEKANDVLVVTGDFKWSDVGTWDALPSLMNSDSDGNTKKATTFTKNTSNCVIYSSDESHLVTCMNLEDVAVIHTDDATLVCPLDQAQDVKELVNNLEEQGFERYL